MEHLRERERITGRADSWIVEELLLSFCGALERIDDFKMDCIGGRFKLVLHKRPKPGKK